jgi:Tub family
MSQVNYCALQVGAYVLNFNGRVTMASVKNFQLVDPDEQNAVVLQVRASILRSRFKSFTSDYFYFICFLLPVFSFIVWSCR